MITNSCFIKNIVLIFVVLSGIVDLKTREIPNYITFPFIIIALLYNTIIGNWKIALLGLSISFILGSVFFAINGMGGGDVKLMMGIATALGIYKYLKILLIASIIGVLWGIGLSIKCYLEIIPFSIADISYKICFFKDYFKSQLFCKDKKSRITIPFGTCLAIATVLQFF